MLSIFQEFMVDLKKAEIPMAPYAKKDSRAFKCGTAHKLQSQGRVRLFWVCQAFLRNSILST